ncbi:MAG: PQQ-dependent dehydrogenase, methanol/ethanol family [Deltaproteobacteria bacterium]|nr:PQQ-dependent dehydrogenase, methanol/ethanol family [Deltaproteobacteria bacterium]
MFSIDPCRFGVQHGILGFAVLTALLFAVGCGPAGVAQRRPSHAPGAVEWPSHGRTLAEQRYSPLDQIDRENVASLGLAWTADLGTRRGIEATPLVVGGVLFVSGAWSVVHAFDAATGKPLWRFDPAVPREQAAKFCCGVVNRGVAAWRGRVFVGTLDGRLIALDMVTGEPIWEVLTVDTAQPYSITGAPRVVQGRVIIGNAGAELGVRGYVSAYEAATGDLAWRVYTVPGPPDLPQESLALERALPTWTGDLWWKVGGGGTVWDSMAYDPEFELLYVGTGNGSPWNRHLRSPGGGDNLYLASILALRPETGELVWHYQTTPAESWDFTATQSLILADLELDGRMRRVLMQAPKNGFFYVLDRETGELLSADAFVDVTWASGVDLRSGRPIETGAGDYDPSPATIQPGPMGAHNWHSMAFSPRTGLAYIPAQHVVGFFAPPAEPFRFVPGSPSNTGIDLTRARQFPPDAVGGELIAWDPVAGRAVWSAPRRTISNGGVLATGGDLVFQGTATGSFVAHDARTGEHLWETEAGTGIIAAPISFAVDGVQFVAIAAGWGGGFALNGGDAAAAAGVRGGGRLLVYRLGGDAPPLPAPPPAPPRFMPPPPAPGSQVAIERGASLFSEYCAACHGVGAVGGGVTPDVRFMAPAVRALFADIVLRGAFAARGMPGVGDRLEVADLEAILLYLADRAHAAP